MGKCHCGICNEDIPIRSKQRILQRYKKGHFYFAGVKNCGLYKTIYKPDHPYTMKDKYVLNHRLIYEHYLKILFDEDIYIPPDIEIHHIIPVDEGGTDALINLIPATHKEHAGYHLIDTSDRICGICGSDKTHIKPNGRPVWYGNKEKGFKCDICYRKDPIVIQRENQTRLERRKRKALLKRLEINTLDKYSN
jgi:hypothetical protein